MAGTGTQQWPLAEVLDYVQFEKACNSNKIRLEVELEVLMALKYLRSMEISTETTLTRE